METPDRDEDLEAPIRLEQSYEDWKQQQVDDMRDEISGDLNEMLKNITRSLGGV